MKIIPVFVLCLASIWIAACSEAIITKENLETKNQDLDGFIFTAKADIYPHFIESHEAQPEKILNKGDRVRLIIEASSEWVKVKSFSENSKRQNAVGKTVIYIFQKEIQEDLKMEDEIERLINNMFIKSPVKK